MKGIYYFYAVHFVYIYIILLDLIVSFSLAFEHYFSDGDLLVATYDLGDVHAATLANIILGTLLGLIVIL